MVVRRSMFTDKSMKKNLMKTLKAQLAFSKIETTENEDKQMENRSKCHKITYSGSGV